MVPDKSLHALTANCVVCGWCVCGSLVTALCACHILVTAIGRRLHPNSRHLRWAKEYQRSDRVSEQWKTVRYVEPLFFSYVFHAPVPVNMLYASFRYNQVTAMLRYYKTPVLLIEFSEGQSFSLQVRMCAETWTSVNVFFLPHTYIRSLCTHSITCWLIGLLLVLLLLLFSLCVCAE